MSLLHKITVNNRDLSTFNAGLTDTKESSIRGMKRISCTIKIDVSREVLDVLMTVLHEYTHVIVRAMVAECTYPGLLYQSHGNTWEKMGRQVIARYIRGPQHPVVRDVVIQERLSTAVEEMK